MKKNSLLFIALALIAGGLIYAKSRPTNQISINTDSASPTEALSAASKFAQAMQSGEPYSCQIVSDDTDMTYQLKNGKMYMTTVTPEYSGYMINDLEYIYTWNDQSSQGSKMLIPTEEEIADLEESIDSLPESPNTPSFASESDYTAYQEQGFAINCEQINLDDSIFTPPSDITFIDPTAMLKEAMPDGQTLDLEKLQELAKQYENN